MTEPRPDPTDPPEVDDTEAAFHAVLDREATAEQRRVVAREPDSAARLETLRDVRSRVGRVEAVAPGVLDGIRRAALDAPDPLDALDGIDGSDPAEPSGAPLAAVPDGRASAPPRRRRRLLPLPAVAALVAGLVALGAVLIITDGRGDDADTAETAAGSSADAAAEYDVSARFDSIDDLRAALETTADPDRLSEWSTGRAGADSPATATGDDQVYGEGQESADDPVASTTVPATGDPAGGALDTAEEVAADRTASRCDTVLRSTREDVGPAQAAVIVEVEGEALLVLSNPVTEPGAEYAVSITVLDALTCVPVLGVAR